MLMYVQHVSLATQLSPMSLRENAKPQHTQASLEGTLLLAIVCSKTAM